MAEKKEGEEQPEEDASELRFGKGLERYFCVYTF